MVGSNVGARVGSEVEGFIDGVFVGSNLGAVVGINDGVAEGTDVGMSDGVLVGSNLGAVVGKEEGAYEGFPKQDDEPDEPGSEVVPGGQATQLGFLSLHVVNCQPSTAGHVVLLNLGPLTFIVSQSISTVH